jgi:hypothetical protein
MYYTKGFINYEFFNNYIKNKLPKKCLETINSNWKNIDEDDRQIDILTFYFNGMNSCYYTELILLDIDNYYIPVLIENINTSSPYCLEKSYFELDNDDNDDDNIDKTNTMELDEICEKLYMIYNKQKFGELIGSLNYK